MSKYSDIALKAVHLIHKSTNAIHPIEAWHLAATDSYPDSVSSRNKGCPKSVFLSLCQHGHIIGVTPGHYTKSRLNSAYATQALTLLENQPQLTEMQLWSKVSNKKYNQQMHVLLSLYKAGFIKVQCSPLSKELFKEL